MAWPDRRSIFVWLLCGLVMGAGADLNFIVLGDWGMGNSQQMSTASLMKTITTTKGSQFVVNVGDNFYKQTKDAHGERMGGVTNLTDPLWKTYFEDVYNGPLESMQFYSVLGNHDYMGNSSAQLEYNSLDKRWIMPARHYTQEFSLGGSESVTFFFLDTSPFIQDYYDHPENTKMKIQLADQDFTKQLSWLDDALSKTQTKWKLVVGHHPIVSHAGQNIYKSRDAQRSMASVQPLLEKYGVQAYFCGHIHDLQHLNANGTDYFISGGGAFGKVYAPDEMMSSFVNFKSDAAGVMAVNLSPERMESTFMATNGTILHTAITNVSPSE